MKTERTLLLGCNYPSDNDIYSDVARREGFEVVVARSASELIELAKKGPDKTIVAANYGHTHMTDWKVDVTLQVADELRQNGIDLASSMVCISENMGVLAAGRVLSLPVLKSSKLDYNAAAQFMRSESKRAPICDQWSESCGTDYCTR